MYNFVILCQLCDLVNVMLSTLLLFHDLHCREMILIVHGFPNDIAALRVSKAPKTCTPQFEYPQSYMARNEASSTFDLWLRPLYACVHTNSPFLNLSLWKHLSSHNSSPTRKDLVTAGNLLLCNVYSAVR